MGVHTVDNHQHRIGASAETAEDVPAVAITDFGDDWVHELIAMTRPGVEINFPYRGLGDRVIPFEYDDFD